MNFSSKISIPDFHRPTNNWYSDHEQSIDSDFSTADKQRKFALIILNGTWIFRFVRVARVIRIPMILQKWLLQHNDPMKKNYIKYIEQIIKSLKQSHNDEIKF